MIQLRSPGTGLQAPSFRHLSYELVPATSTPSPTSLPPRVLQKVSGQRHSVTRRPVNTLKGYAITGGQDTVINIFRLDSPKDDPDFSLLGHTENVCALDATPSGVIISGSWDK